ncbi:MAG: porphobilinogen deaminase [Flaviaesturariibacter sp.]|nr:porphobilinogen deaminase [Flaviaesturariibacter sp.]
MANPLRIGTRDSQLAVWQATLVKEQLEEIGVPSELVYIKSEGDIDLVTPLYELGVQGVFTKTLDAALLSKRIDIAVHSMKDVPTQLAAGIRQAAVVKRATYKDIFVYKGEKEDIEKALEQTNKEQGISNDELEHLTTHHSPFTIATSSVRRIAQWLHRYPKHRIEDIRGNVNTRLRKVQEHHWNGAIFAAAGLERINLRPQTSVDLDWMLPAPAQGAIMIVCREEDAFSYDACHAFNDAITALCTKIERDFLRRLMGGCSTPISGLAVMDYAQIVFRGNICSTDGKQKYEIEKAVNISDAASLGTVAAEELLSQPSAAKIVQDIRHAKN